MEQQTHEWLEEGPQELRKNLTVPSRLPHAHILHHFLEHSVCAQEPRVAEARPWHVEVANVPRS